MKEIEKAQKKHPETAFIKFAGLFKIIWYFFLVFLPTRSWRVQAGVTSDEHKKKRTQSRFSNFISALVDPVLGFVSFKVYTVFCRILGRAVLPVAGILASVFQYLPASAPNFVFPLIFFAIRFKDFLKLSTRIAIPAYVFLTALTFAIGIPVTFVFCWMLLLTLHIVYSQTSEWERWFFGTLFVTFGSNVVIVPSAILVWGIPPPVFIFNVNLGMLVFYLRITDWIDSKTKIVVREDERERFFHRGTVTRQLDFIKAQGAIFMTITLIAIACTFGQLASYPTFQAPETMANVFCKTASKQLHCRVNMTYVNPAHDFEHCKDNSGEWDFCGTLPCSCQHHM